MSNQTTLQKAIEIVTKATEEDKNGNFEEALKVKKARVRSGHKYII